LSGTDTSQLSRSLATETKLPAIALPTTPGSAHTDSATANSAAESAKAAIPEVTEIVEVSEDNDPNNLIGRPNGYVAASVLIDSRLPRCTDLGADCGAMIEQWPDQAAAQARADYIQTMLKSMPMLGQEWDTVKGGLLLRVAGTLKPSEAQAYESALTH
jgi:serine/threonine protein kinase, bacterial